MNEEDCSTFSCSYDDSFCNRMRFQYPGGFQQCGSGQLGSGC